jgi:hypothetical protein
VVSELDSGSGLHGRRCEANPPPSTSPGEDDAVGWTSSSADGGQTEGKAVKGLPEPRSHLFLAPPLLRKPQGVPGPTPHLELVHLTPFGRLRPEPLVEPKLEPCQTGLRQTELVFLFNNEADL